MTIRQRVLEAAARTYASEGFHGATTRRIAEEAGVNEVTLFRLFGSKAALLAEAMKAQRFISPPEVAFSEELSPLQHITASIAHVMANLRRHRDLIRQGMAELEHRPEMCRELCQEKRVAFEEFLKYCRALVRREGTEPDVDVRTAASMMFSAVFQDVMGRDMAPETYPPEQQAAARYARVFLRSIGVPVNGKARRRRSGRRAVPA